MTASPPQGTRHNTGAELGTKEGTLGMTFSVPWNNAAMTLLVAIDRIHSMRLMQAELSEVLLAPAD